MIFGKRSQESQSPRTDQAFFLPKNKRLIIIKQYSILKALVNRQENNKEKDRNSKNCDAACYGVPGEKTADEGPGPLLLGRLPD
jgi:hypothetical protein